MSRFRPRISVLSAIAGVLLVGVVVAGCHQSVYIGVNGKVLVNGTAGPQEVPASNRLPKLTVTESAPRVIEWSNGYGDDSVMGTTLSIDLKGTVLEDSNAGFPCGSTVELRPLVRGASPTDPWVEVAGYQQMTIDASDFAEDCKNGLPTTTVDFVKPSGWSSVVPGGKLGLSVLVRSAWGFDPSSATCRFWRTQHRSGHSFADNSWNLFVTVVEFQNGCVDTSGDIYAAVRSGQFEVQVNPAATAATAPTARVVSRAAPVWVAGGAFSDSRTLWYEVDGRASTDPAGGALTYAWDLDGDGVYGDASAAPDPAGTLPAGVAVVPVATLNAAATAGRDLTVGVKVSNAAGESSTATTTIHPLPNQSYDGNYRSSFTLDSTAPSAGSTLTLSLTSGMYASGWGCLDADGDGTFEQTIDLPGYTTTTATTAALAAGPHVVTVAFVNRSTSCSTPTADPTALTFRQVYIAGAVRRQVSTSTKSARASASGELRLRAGAIPVEGKSPAKTVETRGSIVNGTYAFPTSGDRPASLSHLRAGTYAARWTKLVQQPQSPTRIGAIGMGSLLLRGVDGTMQCLAVDTRLGRSTFTIIGGTGTASRLRGAYTGDQLSYPITKNGMFATVGGIRVLKPFTSAVAISASASAPRALPSACRTLFRYLPKQDDGGGSSTPSVVTG